MVKNPNYDLEDIPLSLYSSRTLSPSKQFEEAFPVRSKLTNYCVQCPWLPIKGFYLLSISVSILSIPLVSITVKRKVATPKFFSPINYYRFIHTPENAVSKVFASITIILKLFISDFVAPLGRNAKVILSSNFTLYKISVIAATKHTYLTTGSWWLFSREL